MARRNEQTWTIGDTQRVLLRVSTADPVEKLRDVTTLPVPVRVWCRSDKERYHYGEAQNSTTRRPSQRRAPPHPTIQISKPLRRSNVEPEEVTLPCEVTSSCYFGSNGTTTTTTTILRRSVTIRLIDDVRLLAAITTFRLESPSWHRREKKEVDEASMARPKSPN